MAGHRHSWRPGIWLKLWAADLLWSAAARLGDIYERRAANNYWRRKTED